MGQFALALTDHGTLAGAAHHINACSEAGVLPIVGCEVYYRPYRKVQGQKELRYEYFHLVLLAKNYAGWKNLMAISTEAHQTGYYEKPCVDLELLHKHHEGLICGTACLGGWLCQRITDGDSTGVDHWLIELKNIFREDLFVEIMPSALEDQIEVNPHLVSSAQQHSIMICTTVDAHAPYEEWVTPLNTQDVLLMISTNQSVKKREQKRKEGEDVFEFKDKTYYLQSEHEARANFAAYHPGIPKRVVDESINNTLLVAARCEPYLFDRSTKMPHVQWKKKAIDLLRDKVYEGLERIESADQMYTARVETELAELERRNVADYFLMVEAIVEWAKSTRGMPDKNGIEHEGEKRPIMVGPGRGSAAGSLVSYCLGITNLDPITYRLLFERFLNPNRKGLPDIDVDFPVDRIDEVEDYTRALYGKDKVVDVIAHATFGPRAAIGDVARVLSIPAKRYREVTKLIDENDRSPIDELADLNEKIDKFRQDYPDAWEHARRIQGQISRKSEHAAALLVTPEPTKDILPLERIGGQKGKMITAWGERAGKGNALISDYGLTKFDWLRIAELSKQQYAVDLIEESTGEKIDLDSLGIHRDPYDVEPEVMRGFAEGYFTGVFQFSGTATRLTRKIKPDNVIDLAAINALIRPGPRGAGEDRNYVERKHGLQPVTYWHDVLEPYLSNTYGIMVFQEQLIEVVHHLGGLTKAEADNFRKIASKLYRDPEYAREVMGEWYEPIKRGFMSNGITEEEFGYPAGVNGNDKPTGIWANFLSFSDYSFNLSHAAGYSVLAYRDMWLKIHYPRQFYAAFLSKGLSQIKEKRQAQKEAAVREARFMGVRVLPPDINCSETDYTVTEDGIRLGLKAVKQVGPTACKEIIKNRPFASYHDFENTVAAQQCNRTVKAALICSGAFDKWDMRAEYSPARIDELEREYLGLSLTSPFAVNNYDDVLRSRIWSEGDFEEALDGTRVTVAGEIIVLKEHVDKKGKLMCFVDLGYGSSEWSCTFFSHKYESHYDLLHSHRPIIIIGEKNTYDGRSSIVVDDAMDVDELAKMVREQAQPAAA